MGKITRFKNLECLYRFILHDCTEKRCQILFNSKQISFAREASHFRSRQRYLWNMTRERPIGVDAVIFMQTTFCQ